MIPGVGDVLAAWPFAASFAAAAGARGVREARRRTVLNEALHELRRPLQAMTLAADGGQECALSMAASALERLDHEINGRPPRRSQGSFAAKGLIEAAVSRWRRAAALRGGRVELSWHAGEAVTAGERTRIAQAIDNLLVNAIEHGGPRIEVEGAAVAGRLRLAIRDSGPRPGQGRRAPAPASRISGRRRHGHGLRLVRRIAAEHGGSFELRRSATATEAVLELPLSPSGGRP
ncbi:MAG TPA: ATP-binding protein [Solirubrobacterales bacterium]|nr:ATP-binding protein [Solirubrobacterales bacterium]